MATPKKKTVKEKKTTPRSKLSRKTRKAVGRKKRKDRIQKDPEFAKTYFEGKSKKAADKKTAFKKRHAKK